MLHLKLIFCLGNGKHFTELGEDTALVQSCASPRTVEMNFQFRKEENIENELDVMNREGAALGQSCISPKTANQKVLKLLIKSIKN